MTTLQELEDLRRYTTDPQTLDELSRRILDLRETLDREPYIFDRRFLFRLLSMGHSQFAESGASAFVLRTQAESAAREA